jgi:aminoglycoside phosphotransferase family enzyme/predicted kinase
MQAPTCQLEPLPPDTAELLGFLGNPHSYPHRTREVEVAETHISWVFLTDRFAYKLKKPVRYEFVDYSTPALRQRACQAEIRLNRRLAPEVYLGVIPVCRNGKGRLNLHGVGQPVDYLVHMQRLPAHSTLEALALAGQLTPRDVRQTADLLARFYQQAPPVVVQAETYLSEVERHVRANREELLASRHCLAAGLVERVHGAQLRVLSLHADLLLNRARDGRIVDGHGDLRPEHIYILPDGPAVIDCLEFSDALRTIDVADELSFLAMECRRLGRPEVGTQIEDVCLQATQDRPPPMLLAFYEAYRACVRAKVAALRHDQLAAAPCDVSATQTAGPPKLAEQYLQIADDLRHKLPAPLLLVIGGLMGTGKSTLAEALADKLGARLLQTDALRRELQGASPVPADYGTGLYRAELREQIYQTLFSMAGRELDAGNAVILDGAFLRRGLRQQAVDLATVRGLQGLVVYCQAPRAAVLERLAGRAARGDSLSEARPELYDLQAREEERPEEQEGVLWLDTTACLAAQVEAVLAACRSD